MNIFITHPQTENSSKKEKEYFLKVKECFPQSEILANIDETTKVLIDALVCVPFDDGEWSMDSWKLADRVYSNGGKIYLLSKGTLNEVDYREVRPLSIKTTKDRKKSNFTFITPQEKVEIALASIRSVQAVNARLRDLGITPVLVKKLKK